MTVVAMAGSCKTCLKIFLVLFNCIVMAVGGAAMATGIWFLAAYNSYLPQYTEILSTSNLSQEVLRDGAIVLLAGGAAIFVFALLGVVAACTVNGCLLVLHASILILLVVVQVAAVILAIIFRVRIATKIDDELSYMFKTEYGNTGSGFTSAFNAFQSDYGCCGWRNASDYINNDTRPQNWNLTVNGTRWQVPEECCPQHNDTCPQNPMQSPFFKRDGCSQSLQDVLFTYGSAIIGLSIAIIALEFLVVVITMVLLMHNVNKKYALS